MDCTELKTLKDLEGRMLAQMKKLIALDRRVTDLEEWMDILIDDSEDGADTDCHGCCNCHGGCCHECCMSETDDDPGTDADDDSEADDEPETLTMPVPCLMALIGTTLECVLVDD